MKMMTRQKLESPFDISLAAARKRSQKEKLWEMFATYALQLSSEDPTRMRIHNVIKLLQDCGVIDESNTEESKIIEKEVAIVCESFLKTHPSDRDMTKRMDFTAFLGLLMHFAAMVSSFPLEQSYETSASYKPLHDDRVGIKIRRGRSIHLFERV
ncbi:hypothetical protein PINS_up013446 [Pythium insidiosum]|nr:hypothetical protein PINS_up013446 [Pythium insidiosum]